MRRNVQVLGAVGIVFMLLIAFFIPHFPSHAASSGGDWSTYMGINARSGFNPAETLINPTMAPHLKLHWTHRATGIVATQPITANGNVYWGVW